ncbi:peptide chain release factor N(5)-glutamine methyltransferase [Kineosporia sp. R_H_3]|uniref:peptide chain release factor N(5)-glutamine methyltransferase n=1 Tax=Kineosporia sp. R_H_3 TaxID=1961848 RepID=UPI001E2D0DD8|nr:peptide chain release factor N(5)-glutamine methyltransferase [Kineosporia sp. R_H_3]
MTGAQPPAATGVPLRTALASTIARLTEAGVSSPPADAQLLVAHALGVPRAELSRRVVLGDALTPAQADTLERLVDARADRVPLQHLTGTAGFRGIELSVGPGVFVPRPETELLAGLGVDVARRLVADGAEQVLVVDLCTGSGAVALAVADEVPQARVVALELDPSAVAWARRNVERLGLGDRVDVRAGDVTRADEGLLADVVGRADVVLANPPYIPPGMVPTEPEVRDHDPEVALYGGGTDGLEVPRAVVACAAALLRPGGVLAMEHADVQGDSARALVAGAGWTDARTLTDLAGRPRTLVARRVPDSSS